MIRTVPGRHPGAGLAGARFAQPGEKIKFEVGHLLFRQPDQFGHLFVAATAEEQQFHALELGPLAAPLPVGDLLLERLDERVFLQLSSFTAACQAAGGPGSTGKLPVGIAPAAARRQRQRGPTPLAPQMVGQFVAQMLNR